MGTTYKGVRPASSKLIEITFTYRGARCRERLKLKPSPANLKRAERHKHAVEDAIERGTFEYAITFPDSPRAAKFSEYKGAITQADIYFTRWLIEQKKILKASTYEGCRKIIKNVIAPHFKGVSLLQVTRSEIKSMLMGITAGNKRLANIQSVMRKALTDAQDEELIENNPLYGWKYKIRDEIKLDDDVDPLTADEQATIISIMKPEYANYIKFSFWTGIRPSEAFALNWDDIDWKKGVIKITKAFTRAAKDLETTKTKAGKREILPDAMDALIAQKKWTYLNPHGGIFLNPATGKRYAGPDIIRIQAWIPALKKAKIRYRKPYQTRHTFASNDAICW